MADDKSLGEQHLLPAETLPGGPGSGEAASPLAVISDLNEPSHTWAPLGKRPVGAR